MAPSIEPATCYVSGSTTTTVEQWRGRALPAAATVPAAKEQQAGGGHAPPRGFPRVPSLVFDIELEERSEGPRGSDDEQVGAKELKRWLMPSSTGEFKLRNDVELGLAQYYQQQRLQGAAASPVESNQLLASWLTKLGYKVSIRTALGGGEGYECLRNLRHVFLAVLPPGAHATTNRFVVDLSFKEQFRIAKPTPRYQSLLDCLPDTYVAPEASVAPLVNFMCHEMAQAFSTTGVVLPPWRQTMSMLSKWLPRKSLEEQVPRSSLVGPAANAGALHAIPAGGAVARRSTDIAGGQVHGHWAHASGTANTALQQQQQLPMEAKLAPAMGMLAGAGQQQQALGDVVMGLTRRQSSGPVVKPMSCEPQRVVVGGNFSTIGFA